MNTIFLIVSHVQTSKITVLCSDKIFHGEVIVLRSSPQTL